MTYAGAAEVFYTGEEGSQVVPVLLCVELSCCLRWMCYPSDACGQHHSSVALLLGQLNVAPHGSGSRKMVSLFFPPCFLFKPMSEEALDAL